MCYLIKPYKVTNKFTIINRINEKLCFVGSLMPLLLSSFILNICRNYTCRNKTSVAAIIYRHTRIVFTNAVVK